MSKIFLKQRTVNENLYWSIAEYYREEGKVKQKILLTLGNTEKAINTLQQYKEYKSFLDEIISIESQPAIKLIQRYNQQNVFIYADSLYPLETRSKRMYANEMTVDDHIELLNVLEEHSGPVIFSRYVCDLYDDRSKHWK